VEHGAEPNTKGLIAFQKIVQKKPAESQPAFKNVI
jgi:hypothetical protein